MDIDLTKGSLSNHFRRISIPASIGFLFNTFYNVVDSIYAGQLGTDSLAGMAISFPIFFLIISISSGIGNGTSALSAIAIGEKAKVRFHNIAKNAIFLAIVFGVVLPLLSPLYLSFLFEITGATGQVLEIGLEYTSTILIGTVFFIINNVLNGLLNAQGLSKPFRNYLIAGFVLNILLDPMFMYGWFGLPAMGVRGVALATVIIQGFGNIYLMVHVIKSRFFEGEMFKEAKISLEPIKDILDQGIPASLNMATIALGVYIINYFVLRYGGPSSVAAYGVSMRIEQVALIPTIGLNVAVLSIIGQNYGAKQIERIKEARYRGMKYGVIIMLIGTVVIVPLAPYLIRLFDTNPDVVEAGTIYLRIEAIAFTTYVFLNINVSTLQGIKKPRFAIVLGVYRQILPIAIFYLLGTTLGWGIFGVWWGIVFINWTAVFISFLWTNRQLHTLSLQLE
ncbi:MATE family efflux transporter [Candidatus Xianfuyuplasma coldseepsis]|uniref:Probable multidrug resistance protein NorM n=1 Tax=Candidatus Xianfuyuplasma coldseepsis TaxID=2782163 RepID=A0A7L7KR50_9MOLU|nr:MATE family efflux transporter [Xianfuyuplasma coldseepsis]QMS84696.1 MATE family efflux transporter [Xianfuyuplasma coldseepsis]